MLSNNQYRVCSAFPLQEPCFIAVLCKCHNKCYRFCTWRWGEYQLSTGTRQNTSCTALLALLICTQSFQPVKCWRWGRWWIWMY